MVDEKTRDNVQSMEIIVEICMLPVFITLFELLLLLELSHFLLQFSLLMRLTE